jgi:hypothetical protein
MPPSHDPDRTDGVERKLEQAPSGTTGEADLSSGGPAIARHAPEAASGNRQVPSRTLGTRPNASSPTNGWATASAATASADLGRLVARRGGRDGAGRGA